MEDSYRLAFEMTTYETNSHKVADEFCQKNFSSVDDLKRLSKWHDGFKATI